MRRVVSDTGPIVHLHEAAALGLLSLTGAVRIPPLVDQEAGGCIPAWESRRPDWLVVNPLEEPHAAAALRWERAGFLDAGEAEAIALAQQMGADWLLTDDAAARLFAQSLGMEVHGSLGVVLWAAAIGHLARADASRVLDRLGRSSLWLSAGILREARAALDELSRWCTVERRQTQ